MINKTHHWVGKEGKQLFRRMVARALVPFVKWFYSGKGCIVLFHRILPHSNMKRVRVGWPQRFEHSVQDVEYTVRWFLHHGYTPIAISELPANLTSSSSHKFVAFTVDDGYVDGYHHIWPLFKRLGVPWTFYVCTDYADRKIVLWGYLLEKLLATRIDPLSLVLPDGEERTWRCQINGEREDAFAAIGKIMWDLESEKCRSWIVSQWGERVIQDLADDLCCSWDQLREMTLDPDITIGSHTVTHPRLTSLTDIQVRRELVLSKQLLEEQLGITVNHLAYPYGAAGPREFEAAKQAGYASAVTTIPSNIFDININHIHSLPRVSWDPHDNVGFRTAVSGADAFIFFRGRRFNPLKIS